MSRSLADNNVYSKRRSSRSMISESMPVVESGKFCANFRRLGDYRHKISKTGYGHMKIGVHLEVLDV